VLASADLDCVAARASWSFAGASTGVESATELINYLLAGADVVMIASALLRHGPGYTAVLLDGLGEWMGRKGFQSVEETVRDARRPGGCR
jgi:dihydroorotate dehydrogenase